MITRIELTNFMSHASTVIEPAPGLTVLTGPNNCGKSAVVAALQILCHNENSTYVLRHGEKECSVKIETDDGHVVEWRRRNSPSYTVDGKLFDRLRGAGLPEELHAALRLPRVDAGNESDYDVHFGAQKAPVFLLGSSPANAARFFASSSDAIRLVQMQRLHKKKVEDANREQKQLEAESKQLNDELERLEPVVDLDTRLAEAERLFDELKLQAEHLAQGARHESAMRQQEVVTQRHAERLHVLNELADPPALQATEPLAQLMVSLAAAGTRHVQAAARVEAVARLSAPPEMADAASLERLTKRIAEAERKGEDSQLRYVALSLLEAPPVLANDQDLSRLLTACSETVAKVTRFERRVGSLTAVAPPPAQETFVPLEDFVSRLQGVSKNQLQCELALRTVEDKLTVAEDALRQAATESVCETCGAPLDPQRVVERAGAGLGGHDHGQ